MNVRNKFKKFGGEFIPDIVEYLKECIDRDPNITISLGCDSVQKRRRTIYAITLMIYNTDIRNGAHVVFFRENIIKVRDNFERLHKEAEYVHQIGEFLESELEKFYVRKDLNEYERKRYKYHVAKCNGEYSHVSIFNEEVFIDKNMILSPADISMPTKLVDIHVDFNPFEGTKDQKGNVKNRSNLSYKAYVPWLRGMGYRVWAKPLSYAATSAADLLLKD